MKIEELLPRHFTLWRLVRPERALFLQEKNLFSEELPMSAGAFTTEDENMRGHESRSVWRSGLTWCREPAREFDRSVLRHHSLLPPSWVALPTGSRARRGES